MHGDNIGDIIGDISNLTSSPEARPVSSDLLSGLKGGLIISVQQDDGSPLGNPSVIAALAQSVAVPGCVALRINSPENIRAARAVVGLPIIGIYKTYTEEGRVWITPTFEAAQKCVRAGASIVALDATDQYSPAGSSVEALVRRIQVELRVPVMADISNYEQGVLAARAGADLVSTTLSGYVQPPFASPFDPPDIDLVRSLRRDLPIPVIAEGRFNTPELAYQALQAGAYAVVVGSAITRPDLVATMFVRGLRGK